MSEASDQLNRRLLRARDVIDRTYAMTLDIAHLARVAHVSESHFIRSFHRAFGEPPHRYLQRRRVERAMYLLRRTDRPVTEVCFDVGFTSVGSFTRTFARVVGESPTAYRGRGDVLGVPVCFAMAWTRPSSFGEAPLTSNG